VIIDRHFSLGAHLNARDVKAVRKTVSGLVKLVYPHGEVAKEELAELVELALEGRRRVKEQLKKMGSFEYHQTSFSYIDGESREERFVGVPEQGGRDMISLDPLAPGQQRPGPARKPLRCRFVQQPTHPLDLCSLNLHVRGLPVHTFHRRLVDENLGVGHRHPFARRSCGEQHRSS